ncbi:MAG: calcium/sodium antiporter [Legionellales bacterium]|jgi:cation:H+ antiporter|nr:calcium/sodium antiporter [Legionellales bacterium]
MWQELLIIAVSFIIMVWSSDIFVDAAVAISDNFNMPKVIIGTVLVGFTTAVPELLVSFDAAINNGPGIAIGNALGSYIINIALVLGVTAIVCPIKVSKLILKREVPVMALSLFIAFLLMYNGFLGPKQGYVLLACLVVTVVSFAFIILRAKKLNLIIPEIKIDVKYGVYEAWFYFALGLCLLIFSARILTGASIDLAHYFGVSDLIIGLTIVAIGTSLPELAASISGVKKGEHDIAIGNVIGSNVLGMFAVLAMPAIFSPGIIHKLVIYRDFGFMAITTLCFWVACYCFDGDKLLINRREGVLGVLLFLSYLFVLYLYPA